MALSQRSASRFFAAFYRWNRWTHNRHSCASIAHHRQSDLARSLRLAASRKFTTGRAYAGTEDAAPRLRQDGDRPISEGMVENDPNAGLIELQSLAELHQRGGREAQPLEDQEDYQADQNIHKRILGQDEESSSAETEAKRIGVAVRKLMRRVPYPVVVLTAAGPQAQQPIPLGIAVSSFNTVTLDPPTISFNIKQPSQTLDAIRADGGRFRIHFLSSRAKAAQLADSFTQGNHAATYYDRGRIADMDFSGKSLNENATFSMAANIQSNEVPAAMECELTQELTVGDHIIAVAKVSNMHVRDEEKVEPLLAYVLHNYVQMSSRPLRRNGRPTDTVKEGKQLSDDPANHMLWGLPLLHNDEDRNHFRNKLTSYVRGMPDLLDCSIASARKQICTSLHIPPEPLGVRLNGVLLRAAQAENRESKAEPYEAEFPSLSEFYGPLSSMDITTIVNRATSFVRNDALFLALHFETFFAFLGLSVQSSGLLASDMMDTLRAAKLAPPFKPSEEAFHSSDKVVTPTLERLEQIEYRLRQYMKSQDPIAMTFAPIEQLANAVDGSTWVVAWLKQVRSRIHVEVFPYYHSPSNYDFSGHLTLPETRVAIMRVLSFLDRPETVTQRYMNMPWHEILHRCRIHPLVSGFNFSFLMTKLRYWYYSSTYSDFTGLVANMVGQNFRGKVSMHQLEERVDKLVKTCVLGATESCTDDKRDSLLTALGLRPECSVTISENGRWLKIDTSSLRRILRSVLEKNYDSFSASDKPAVDAFLEKTKDDSVHIHKWDYKGPKISKYTPSPRMPEQDDSSQDMMRALRVGPGHVRLMDLKRNSEDQGNDKRKTGRFKGFTAYGPRGNVEKRP